MSIQRWLNMPKRAASTLSPGERVLLSEASHAPVPLAGEDKGRPRGGLEDLLQILQDRGGQRREVGRPVILHGPVHGPKDPVRRVGGPGYEEKVAAGHPHLAKKERGRRGESRLAPADSTTEQVASP